MEEVEEGQAWKIGRIWRTCEHLDPANVGFAAAAAGHWDARHGERQLH